MEGRKVPRLEFDRHSQQEHEVMGWIHPLHKPHLQDVLRDGCAAIIRCRTHTVANRRGST